MTNHESDSSEFENKDHELDKTEQTRAEPTEQTEKKSGLEIESLKHIAKERRQFEASLDSKFKSFQRIGEILSAEHDPRSVKVNDIQNALERLSQRFDIDKDANIDDVAHLMESTAGEFASFQAWGDLLAAKIHESSEKSREAVDVEERLKKDLKQENSRNVFLRLWRRGIRGDLQGKIRENKINQYQLEEDTHSAKYNSDVARGRFNLLREKREAIMRKTANWILRDITEHYTVRGKEPFDPEIIDAMNQELFDQKVMPEIEKVKQEGVITPEEAEEFVDLLRERLTFNEHHFRNLRISENKKRREELDRKSKYKLQNIGDSVISRTAEIPNDSYKQLSDYMYKSLAQKRLHEFIGIAESIGQEHLDIHTMDDLQIRAAYLMHPKQRRSTYYNEPVDIDIGYYHSFKGVKGTSRWPIVRESFLVNGIASVEELDDIEQRTLQRIYKYDLKGTGATTWPGTEAVFQMRDIGNFHAIPFLLRQIMESGFGHTNNEAVYVLRSMLKKCDTTMVDQLKQTMSETERALLDVLRDENSYLNRYQGGHEPLDSQATCGALYRGKQTLLQEKYAKELEEHGESAEQVQRFYFLHGGSDEILTGLSHISELTGIDEKALIREYFDELTKGIDPDKPERLYILDVLSEKLGETRASLLVDCIDRLKTPQREKPFNPTLQHLASVENQDFAPFLVSLSQTRLDLDSDGARVMKEFTSSKELQTDQSKREIFLDSIVRFISKKNGAEALERILKWYAMRPEGVSGVCEIFRRERLLDAVDKKVPDRCQIDDLFQEHDTSLESGEDQLFSVAQDVVERAIASKQAEFINVASREDWKVVFSEDAMTRFLNVLPQETDEKRNAFTHNQYDRTTEFMRSMVLRAPEDFILQPSEFDIITDYVERYGLAINPLLFRYYRNIRLHEKNGDPFPLYQQDDNVTSVEALDASMAKMREAMYNIKQMMEPGKLSSFEVAILDTATGKSTHRFNTGRPNIEKMIADFTEARNESKIAALPEKYKTEEMKISNVTIEFDAKSIQQEYDTLKVEILRSSEDSADISGLIERATSSLQDEISKLETVLSAKPQLVSVRTKLEQYKEIAREVQKAKTGEQLLVALLKIEAKGATYQDCVPILREIVFRKIFFDNYSPIVVQELIATLRGDMSAKSISGMIDLVDNFAKDHVLNREHDTETRYWKKETWDTMEKTRNSPKGMDIFKIFAPQLSKLKEAARNFQIIESGSAMNVQAIPDRGFIGEMSAYLADVCYSAEYPLLEKYPNVVPYKFVSGEEGGDRRFIGSVLVFELKDTNDDGVLLVRGFDVPKEDEINIPEFIENYLDRLEAVARSRGLKRIFIPGLRGAISNYSMTLNHMTSRYITGKEPVGLKENFAFNTYDLTENCYVAREIT